MFGASNRIVTSLILFVIAAFAALVSFVLPLPILFPGALITACLLLIPRTPLAMLVILLTLSPLRALMATELRFTLPLDIGQFLLLLYLGVWLTHRIRLRKPILVLQPNPVLFAIAGLTAVFAIGAWTSASLGNWLNEWLKWMLMALIVWQLSLSDGANWRWLIFAVLISAVANALVGLYIFFGGSGADHLVILGRFFRAFGTFGQPNPFGGFMGIVLPISIMGGFSHCIATARSCLSGKPVERLNLVALACYGLACIVIAAGLIASWSRGAWLGTAVALLVMLVALPRRLINGIIITIGIGLLFVGLWFAGLLPGAIVSRLTTAATDLIKISDVRGVNISPVNYAVVERLAHWQAAVDMAHDRPLFGVGLGSYEAVYDDYRLVNWEAPLGHAHNLYLNMLAETGIIGLAAFLAFWLLIFTLTWRCRRHPDLFSRSIAIGLLGCWTYIAVHSLFDNLYVNNLFFHIGVLLSVLAILYRQTTHSLKLE